MSLISGIKYKAGNYFLKMKMATVTRNRKLINIDSAGSVGILFELTDENTYRLIHEYLQKLQSRKVKTKAIGYSVSKLLTNKFLPVLSFDLFTGKQLNWLDIPRGLFIKDFTDTEFDICINVASENVFPLKFIAAISKARLRAGSYHNDQSGLKKGNLTGIYDVLIKTDENHDQVKLLEDIHEYLLILNPRENA
ncbi:MAG: hypothetical protein K0B08_06990 [Bacteroidales bacterium]|nr:hypothetical protein [Bacteroidales bacterium]